MKYAGGLSRQTQTMMCSWKSLLPVTPLTLRVQQPQREFKIGGVMYVSFLVSLHLSELHILLTYQVHSGVDEMILISSKIVSH